MNAAEVKRLSILRNEKQSSVPSSDLCSKIDETTSYLKVEGKKLMDRKQSKMMELVIWSAGDKI